MKMDGYAKREAERRFPGPAGSHYSSAAEMEWHEKSLERREGFVHGILHLAARLAEDDVIEAGARAHHIEGWGDDLDPEGQMPASDVAEMRAALAAMLAKIGSSDE